MSDDAVWPDDLEEGDTVTLLDKEFEVTDVDGYEVEAECDGAEARIFRWALTAAVGAEIEVGFAQDEFADHVEAGDDR